MSDKAARAIQVVDVERVYRRGRERVEVLRGVHLDVRLGEFVALMGPSGSGKTTLLNLIGGLDRPDRGRVEVLGTRLDELSERRLAAWRSRHIGFVFQFYHLVSSLSAARNVELPLLLTSLRRAARRQHVAAALTLAGLADRCSRFPAELSGGEQQRIAIARAIVANPSVLLCDEPTGDLDRDNGDRVLELLRTLAAEHAKTVVMVTHDPRAASRASRVVSLADGQLRPGATL
jgi:putative ABC transport system ATP-binding protein